MRDFKSLTRTLLGFLIREIYNKNMQKQNSVNKEMYFISSTIVDCIYPQYRHVIIESLEDFQTEEYNNIKII